MHYFNKSKLAFFDCDDTLIMWDVEKFPHKEEDLITISEKNYVWKILPNHKNIDLLKRVRLQGYGVVVWSAAGHEWALKVAKLLKLEEFVDIVMNKPELAVDDLLDASKIIKQVIWIDPISGEYKRNE